MPRNAPTPRWVGQGEGTQAEFELISATIRTIYDGRFANNGWLQELEKPVTKLTWDNVGVHQPGRRQRSWE